MLRLTRCLSRVARGSDTLLLCSDACPLSLLSSLQPPSGSPASWTPDSWQTKESWQQPEYPDKVLFALAAALTRATLSTEMGILRRLHLCLMARRAFPRLACRSNSRHGCLLVFCGACAAGGWQEQLAQVIKDLERSPPLVFAGEARMLEAKLGEAALGKAFLLQVCDLPTPPPSLFSTAPHLLLVSWSSRPVVLGRWNPGVP